mgnify:CR=1 FL=1
MAEQRGGEHRHQKAHFLGAHPNSLMATSDPKVRKAIRRGMRRMYEDQKAFESWVRAGFTSGGWSEEGVAPNPYADPFANRPQRLEEAEDL